MRIWYTSDLHLGHKLVSEIRGFDSVYEHDKKLMDNWRRNVGPKDTVYVLGDISMNPYRQDCGSTPLEKIDSLPGKKILVSGNHDATHPMHRDSHKHFEEHTKVFDVVTITARRKIAGQNVLLSHFPYERDREEVRYKQWRLPNYNEWLLHGHTHTPDRGRGKEIHIGLDAWNLCPVSQDVVASLMQDRMKELG